MQIQFSEKCIDNIKRIISRWDDATLKRYYKGYLEDSDFRPMAFNIVTGLKSKALDIVKDEIEKRGIL